MLKNAGGFSLKKFFKVFSTIECFETPANDSLDICEGNWKDEDYSPMGKGLPILAHGLKRPLFSEPIIKL